MASVYITNSAINSGVPVQILCNSITIGGEKLLDSSPDVNIQSGPVEVQTQSFNNLGYAVNGIMFTGAVNTLSWEHLLELYKQKYTGTNYTTLNVTYGTKVLAGLSASTNIKVVLKSLNFPISVTDSKNGYMPVGSIQFIETA